MSEIIENGIAAHENMQVDSYYEDWEGLNRSLHKWFLEIS